MALEWSHQTRMYWNIHTIPRHPTTGTYKTRESFGLAWGFIAMASMGDRSPSSSVNSNSESGVSEEVVQNVGLPAWIFSGEGVMPVALTCNPGDDILRNVSLACEYYNRVLYATTGVYGDVINPSLIYGGNQIKTHEGVHTLLNMNMATPFGTNDDPATTCTISFVGGDGKYYGGRVSGSLIAASQITIVLLLDYSPFEDADDDEDMDDEDMDDEDMDDEDMSDDSDTSDDADTSEDADSDSCLSSA